MNTASTSANNRIWDLPTRLFHWALVVLIALQFASGEFELFPMRWHYWFGYTTLVLVVFRILWGFFGSQTSRFSDFLCGPVSVWRYLRSLIAGKPTASLGHNPLGGWSVMLMLACLLVQVVSGLFSSDDIMTDGPLVGLVTHDTVETMTWLHQLNENVLLVLISVHVIAAFGYLLIRHDNLITPMITGVKRTQAARSLRFAPGWRALILLAVAAGLVAAVLGYYVSRA